MVVLSVDVDTLILFLGITLALGYTSSLLLQKIGVPNVLVYILVGFILGNFFLTEIIHSVSFTYWFKFVETIALGLIGFQIGTEMELSLLKKESKLITILTLSQVIITFALVFGAALVYTNDLITALIFGGLATATAPAATIEIIRKFKAKGPLTTKIQWVLAFDDLLAVLIVEGIIVYASIALIGESVTIVTYLAVMAQEIGLAILFGLIFGYILDIIIERIDDKLTIMEISLGFLIVVMGLSLHFHTSVILACMTVGALSVNREGNNYQDAAELLEIIMSPVLIVFFVLIGAELQFSQFNPFNWFAVIYFLVRAIGKIYGTNFGAKIAKAEPVIQKNLGLSMLPQGGVALGLMAVAADLMMQDNRPEVAALLLSTIVISTVFSEGIGSFTSLFGLRRAGEIPQSVKKD